MKRRIISTTFSTALFNKYPEKGDYIMKHLKEYNMNNVPRWEDFTKVFLVNFVRYLKSVKLSDNSIRTYCAYIKSVFNEYKEEHLLPTDNFAEVLNVKKVATLNTYLTIDEIQKIIDYVPENIREHTIRNQFLLSCMTGMRLSDVRYLNPSYVVQNQIVYVAQKSQNVVKTVCSDIAKELIHEGKTKIYSKVTFNETIKQICKKVGINQVVTVVQGGKTMTGEKHLFIRSHIGRISFATNMYHFLKDLYKVSKLMGHANIEMTANYIVGDNDDQQVIGYFDQFKLAASN